MSLAWGLPDERNDYADRVLLGLNDSRAMVPHLWRLEIANTLLVGERRSRISAAEATRFAARLVLATIAVEDDVPNIERLIEIGRSQNLSAYDAAYLELASRRRLPLATLDRRLQAAAERMGISLFDPR